MNAIVLFAVASASLAVTPGLAADAGQAPAASSGGHPDRRRDVLARDVHVLPRADGHRRVGVLRPAGARRRGARGRRLHPAASCDAAREYDGVELVGILSPRDSKGGSSGSWLTREAFDKYSNGIADDI